MRARVPPLIVAVALLLSSLAPAASPRVAIMPVRPADGGEAQATMRNALATSDSVQVIDDDALKRLLASAADSGIACDASLAACATRICAFAGLDFVLTTHIERAPQQVQRATLALHDCIDGREVRKVSALLGDKPAQRSEGIAELAHAVLGEQEARGELVVTAPEGVVIVDGVERGAPPLTLVIGAGVHDVSWRARDGAMSTMVVDVPVAASARATFASRANAERAPLHGTAQSTSTLAFIAGGGLALGAVVALGGAAGAWLVSPTDRTSYNARDYNDAVTLGRALLGVSLGGAVLAGIAGGALTLSPGEPPPATSRGATAGQAP